MVDGQGTILALDVGSVRIGLALANLEARLAQPAGTIANDTTALNQLREVCERESVTRIVIGLPRGLGGQDTEQTNATRDFGTRLANQLNLPISWQDEAVTSMQAEAELQKRGKSYSKADIDALSATYILEDYLHENV